MNKSILMKRISLRRHKDTKGFFFAPWCLCGFLFALVLPLAGRAAASDFSIQLRNGAFDPLLAESASSSSAPAQKDKALKSSATNAGASAVPDGGRIRLLQFDGPPEAADLDALEARGIHVLQYIPNYTYIVMADGATSRSSQQRAFPVRGERLAQRHVRWTGAFPAGVRRHPRLDAALAASRAKSAGAAIAPASASESFVQLQIILVETGAPSPLPAFLEARGGRMVLRSPWGNGLTRVRVEGPPEIADDLEQLEEVLWIEPWRAPTRLGEREAQICAGNISTDGTCASDPGGGYKAWLDALGLSGAGYIVQIIDDGLSQGIDTNAAGTAHPDILGRIEKIDNATADPLGDSGDGHGHINASILLGQPVVSGQTIADSNGYLFGQGVAPQARVWATKVFRNNGVFDTSGRTDTQLVIPARRAGALVSSNSWGIPSTFGDYDALAIEYDRLVRDADPQTAGYQPMTFVFSAGNQGTQGAKTITSPASGKNVIGVGMTENCDRGPSDGCGIGVSQSDNAGDLAKLSSRGPDADGRLAPTLVAPGTHIMGAASDSPNYDGEGVCGYLGSGYYPPGQTRYTWSSGTSHAAPLVSGAAILVNEHYHNLFGANPSPALVRAALVLTAAELAGGSSNDGGVVDAIPSNKQGWGRMNLGALFAPDCPVFYYDQKKTFTATGQVFEQIIHVHDSVFPLHVVLCWTDAPGYAGAAKALVNDLDLEVELGSALWRGNVYSGGVSVANSGAADTLNTMESVHIPSPAPGLYIVRVKASLLGGDALPLTGGSLEQDFAIAAFNASEQGPKGTLSFERGRFSCQSEAQLTLSDSDLREAGTTRVEVQCALTGDAEHLDLAETAPGTGIFQGALTLSGTAGGAAYDGMLRVADGGVILATYNDANDGAGQPAVATAQAVLDCVSPSLLSKSVTGITPRSATISITTDEATTAYIEYAAGCTGPFTKIEDLTLSFAHTFALENLSSCSVIQYRIGLMDEAGNSVVISDSGNLFEFQTKGYTAALDDDFEPEPLAGWTHKADRGTDTWSLAQPAEAHSPTHAWFAADEAALKDASLISPPVDLGATSVLRFWHTYLLESGYDGAVIEISTDGGSTWNDLGPAIRTGGYDSTISSSFQSPISGRNAWTGGMIGAMTAVEVDLGAYAGSGRLIRWRLCCDVDLHATGWYVDDVEIGASFDCLGPVAKILLSPMQIPCEGTLTIELRDSDLSQAESASVSIRTSTGGGPVAWVLDQKVSAEGIFRGTVPVTPGPGGNQVTLGGTLTAYSGSQVIVEAQDQSLPDCPAVTRSASVIAACDWSTPVDGWLVW